MSLYQCGHCGCVENTAFGIGPRFPTWLFDWHGIEERKGKALCSACAPTRYADWTPTHYGKWHDKFPRIFLPMHEFTTNAQGDLEHIESGSTDYRAFAIQR